MPDFLTPAEVEALACYYDTAHYPSEEVAATLREMAAICEAVAEGRVKKAKWCVGDHCDHVNIDEDTYLRARKLMGLE